MRRAFLVPSILVPVLAAGLWFGLGPSYLITAPRGPLAPTDVPTAGTADEVDIERSAALRYTSHRAPPMQAEVVAFRLDVEFTAAERAKIALAVAEWNHALNGFVRFEIVSPTDNTPRPMTWRIKALATGPQERESDNGEALALTQPIPPVGGLMIVYTNRIGRRDLRGVILHELGHVLGLGHDPQNRLMSIRYVANNQQCIDKATIEAVATARNLPLAELNWCETVVGNAVP